MPPGSLPRFPPPRHEPIAIVGIGCRYPGANDVRSFWRILHEGTETVDDYPDGRFGFLDRFYADPDASGIASRRGGFLSELDRFDAEFFGISPREAALLDPQQRLLLEVGFEALEDAGIPRSKVAGSRTGVFAGVWTSDYEACVHAASREPEFHATTGTGRYALSGRLAYFLDLRGPNLTVDTACSSSLVAIHLACQSLRLGESELALAGGVNVILRPEVTRAYSSANMLSPDGRSKFGDASANGYVRGEGAGLVVLKTLARALADGDSIYASIRGSAVNNDGHSGSLLISPSRGGQEGVLRLALRDAGVRAEQIDYIEAHGTGTAVGDPVEIETIGLVMKERDRKRPCVVGSCKTNIGHTESAAGVAGLIKVALSLERQTIPATLHFENPNPAIAWESIPVVIRNVRSAWPATEGGRFAGVSGFGITGTNAHIVLESAPERRVLRESDSAASHLFVLSARSPAALKDVAASWQRRLAECDAWPESLADLAYTAAVRRAHFDCRLSFVAGARKELSEQLDAWLAGESGSAIEESPAARSGPERSKTVFVFPGQGGQWIGMGKTLYSREPVFRSALRDCDEAIGKHTGWSIVERLISPAEQQGFDEIDVVQPCLFGVMVALAALWDSWGVRPDAVIGHSMGECAAAFIAGALSLDDAAAVICTRSRLMKRARGLGLMALAELGLEDAARIEEAYGGRISLAANNSAASSVFSGEAAAVEELIAGLESRGIFCRRIRVDVASHCAQMEPMIPELVSSLADIRPGPGAIPFYSTTTAEIEDGTRLDAVYWGRNLRQPVLFSTALQNLLRDGCNTFIEINAHPTLLQAVETGIQQSGKQAVAIGSLRRDHEERTELLGGLGALYGAGYAIDWNSVYPEGTCLRLPTYPWQRERHWIEEPEEHELSDSVSAGKRRPPAAAYELKWEPMDVPALEGSTGKMWVVVDSSGASSSRIMERLESAGDVAVLSRDPEAIEETIASAGISCHGVIHVCPDEDNPHESLRVIQALARCRFALTPRLWLLTRNAAEPPGTSESVEPGHASVLGLANVVAWEYPELRCATADLPALPSSADIENLCRVLRRDGPDEQIAIRGNSCFAARCGRMALPDFSGPLFHADATYLITGGLGGVGLELARWLAANGARHLALAGRRLPSGAAQIAIGRMEAGGVSVRTFAVDIADEQSAVRVLGAIAGEMPPLRGIFHLAAVVESSRLADLDRETLGRAMHPKAAAAWTLHHLTKEMPLDCFVLFSSLAAGIGHPGMGAYAAANAVLDGLARYRRSRGLAGLSVQWGAWKETGMAAQESVRRGIEAYRQQGIFPLEPAAALDVLARLMRGSSPEALVVSADWDLFSRSFGISRGPRRFIHLAPEAPAPMPQQHEGGDSVVESLLAEPTGARRRNAIEAFLKRKLALVLKTRESRIGTSKTFGSMGLDSLMGLDFVRRIGAATSISLPATVVFNYPTVELLTGELAARLNIPLDHAGAENAEPAGRAVSKLEGAVAELSEEQAIEALLTGTGK